MDRAIFNLTKYSIFFLFTLHRYTDKHTLQVCPAPPLCLCRCMTSMANFHDDKM